MKPILFNTEMVRAIQDGRKTVTRRVIRWDRNDVIKTAGARGKLFGHIPEDKPVPEQLLTWYIDRVMPRPFAVGDLLWVRETWDFVPCITCRSVSEACELFPVKPDQMETADGRTDGCFLYRALDGEHPLFDAGHRWRPSIHMPKAAARIFLRVTEIYTEKLWESFRNRPSPIRELAAEGLQVSETCLKCWRDHIYEPCVKRGNLLCVEQNRMEQCFQRLWDSTIPKAKLAADGWAADPWVWVIRFERCEKPAGWPE